MTVTLLLVLCSLLRSHLPGPCCCRRVWPHLSPNPRGCKVPDPPEQSGYLHREAARTDPPADRAPGSPGQIRQLPHGAYATDRPDEGVQPLPQVYRLWHFVILGPELSTETVVLRIPVPCNIDHAIALICDMRAEPRQALYDSLLPVVPQPSDEFGTLVCRPAWAADRCLVCLDLRAHDGRLFTRELPKNMNRESLLLAAGLPLEAPACVHYGSNIGPLCGHTSL